MSAQVQQLMILSGASCGRSDSHVALTCAFPQISALTCGNGSHDISMFLAKSRCRVPRMCPRRSSPGLT